MTRWPISKAVDERRGGHLLVQPRNVENKTGITPKFTVGSYEELYRIVMEPEELENLGVRNRRHSNEALL